jgi:hypothetical protein
VSFDNDFGRFANVRWQSPLTMRDHDLAENLSVRSAPQGRDPNQVVVEASR